MESENKTHHGEEIRSKPSSLFIPAGVLMGLGVGFLANNVPAGLFIGIGIGFAAFAISLFIKKKLVKNHVPEQRISQSEI